VQSYQGDGLDIPDFLRRPKNVPPGLLHDTGSPYAGREPSVGQSTVMAPTNNEPQCRKRWPLTDRDNAVIAELKAGKIADAKDKSNGRDSRKKQSKSDQAALTAGKIWDTRTAKWT
jgi:hypothetical protein